jgi:hypothetical protein
MGRCDTQWTIAGFTDGGDNLNPIFHTDMASIFPFHSIHKPGMKYPCIGSFGYTHMVTKIRSRRTDTRRNPAGGNHASLIHGCGVLENKGFRTDMPLSGAGSFGRIWLACGQHEMQYQECRMNKQIYV